MHNNLYHEFMIPDRISCGGVVFRKNNIGTIEVLLLHRFQTAKWLYDSWHLPKGTQDLGETCEQTALREIREETGYAVKVRRKLGELESKYEENGKQLNKLTHYFLCEPIKQTNMHDHEHDEVLWVKLEEAIALVSLFPIWEKEEKILEKFASIIKTDKDTY